jgi:hypothetical protein
MAVAPQVAPAEIIRQDQDDIRWPCVYLA